MACASSCGTQDHQTWGECVRAQGQMIGYANSANGLDLTAQRRFDANLDAYRAARAEGIQPAGTSPAQVERAVRLSDAAGKPYEA